MRFLSSVHIAGLWCREHIKFRTMDKPLIAEHFAAGLV